MKNQVVQKQVEGLKNATELQIIENSNNENITIDQATSLNNILESEFIESHEITSKNLNTDDLVIGEQMKAIFMSISKSESKFSEVEKDSVMMLIMNNEVPTTFTSMSSILVGSASRVNLPCKVLITYLGKQKGAKYQYDNFKVVICK